MNERIDELRQQKRTLEQAKTESIARTKSLDSEIMKARQDQELAKEKAKTNQEVLNELNQLVKRNEDLKRQEKQFKASCKAELSVLQVEFLSIC